MKVFFHKICFLTNFSLLLTMFLFDFRFYSCEFIENFSFLQINFLVFTFFLKDCFGEY